MNKIRRVDEEYRSSVPVIEVEGKLDGFATNLLKTELKNAVYSSVETALRGEK